MKDTSKKFEDYTILYVEDEQVIRSNVQTCLNYLFTVVIAENGQEGVKKFQEEKIDLVITDINMPKKDGISMLRDIKKLSPETPCIVTSAFDMELIEKIKSLALFKCLSKPFDIKDLLNCSMNALELK